jgi:hypothetical protein
LGRWERREILKRQVNWSKKGLCDTCWQDGMENGEINRTPQQRLEEEGSVKI